MTKLDFSIDPWKGAIYQVTRVECAVIGCPRFEEHGGASYAVAMSRVIIVFGHQGWRKINHKWVCPQHAQEIAQEK
jgi:hypothetical protein